MRYIRGQIGSSSSRAAAAAMDVITVVDNRDITGRPFSIRCLACRDKIQVSRDWRKMTGKERALEQDETRENCSRSGATHFERIIVLLTAWLWIACAIGQRRNSVVTYELIDTKLADQAEKHCCWLMSVASVKFLKKTNTYYGSGTVAHTASQWRHTRSAAQSAQTLLHMHIYLKNSNFHPDPIWNDRVLGFFAERRHTGRRTTTRTRWVAIW